MKRKITLKGIWEVIKDSFSGFSDDKVTKMSGSLAYYTIFSMAPLLIIIISLSGFFFGQDAAEGRYMGNLRDLSAPTLPCNSRKLLKMLRLQVKER